MRAFLIFFLSAIILSSFIEKDKPPKKIALVIAIGNYDSTTGWKNISSINDIRYVKSALINQGFEEIDIDTLKNEQATKAGIQHAIDLLIAKAGKGDIVVFHFSGHGQQIFDNPERKDEMDGYDEALVPYNAKMRYDSRDKGQNHLRDDELGDKLKLLRTRIGKAGSLLVLIDACHSGTATRGEEMSATRGTEQKFAPQGYNPVLQNTKNTNEGIFDDAELLSNMVVISAASADQLNYETKDDNKEGVGSLSYAFSRAVSQISGDISYKMLFEKIKNDIQSWKPFQNPQIEGNTDQKFFGGIYLKADELIRVEKWVNDSTIIIPRGAIHSVRNGTAFKIFPVEATDYNKTKPIGSGQISNVGMGRSTARLLAGISERAACKIVFDNKSFGDMDITVNIVLDDAKAAASIRDILKPYDYINLNKPHADILIEPYKEAHSNQQALQVVAVNDSILWQKRWPSGNKNSLSVEETTEILHAIKQYSRAQFLRSIYTPADDKSFEYVQVELIPGKIKSLNGRDTMIQRIALEAQTNAKGDLQFVVFDETAIENEGFIIRIRNNHDYPVYISVLDIQPDNVINITIPDPGDPYSSADDYKIPPRSTFETRPVTLFPPYGKEFMKLLITTQPMDLKSVQTRSTTRGAGSSFERFYNDTFKDDDSERSRGPKVAPVKVDEVRIVPITFDIVKHK
ncbi:MAG: caspase family protein [Chitinophagaceae bacterium]|nr:caspase family protein [Chitinophagaceae bacterium]